MKQVSAKNVILFCVVALIWSLNLNGSFAQSPSIKKTSITLLSDDGQKTSVKFETGDMVQNMVTTSLGEAVIIKTDKGTPILKKGFPDLPKLTTSVIIPNDKEMQVTVTGSHFTDYGNVRVAPSKGTLLRTIDPSMVSYEYGSSYQENKFFPEKLAELREPYILRDFRGQTIIVYPYQYNPVTQTLRVYSDITVSVSPKGSGTGINVLNTATNSGKVSAEFGHVYSNHFINYNNGTRYEPLAEEGNMLIISYGSFMNAMQPFIDWKIQKGIKTEMVDVATIGNNKTAIKDYVLNYYNTKGLTFLLLVGDYDQVTSSTTGAGDSDNDYGYILGNDHYQEIFVGRFSAETEADVTTQVNRTLMYEKTPLIDSYYAKGVGIASEFGPGDDNEWDWQHEENIRTELMNYNYTAIQDLYNGTWAGTANDASGNPTAANLADQVNAGIGIINYTGHGSTSSIVTTGFNNTSVNSLLTNTTKWPFLWIVGCEVGNFTGPTCFAEAWARATYNGVPSGGLASMMSTISQYWDEPMEGQDEMNLILTESYENNIKRTFGGISINGCFSMNDAYGGSGYDMTDTWDCFGDPSVFVRTALPQSITATHDASVLLGSTTLTVTCDAQDAVAALTSNGEIIASEKVSGGVAVLTFSPLMAADTLTLTITGYNLVPYIAAIPTVAPAGPFVIGSSFTVDDSNGNNNGLADYNEQVTLDASLENVGISIAGNVTATIATTDPFITITDPSQSFGDILNDAVSTQGSAFAFTVADDVPDAHVALFACTVSDNLGNSWTSNFQVLLNAPAPGAQSFVINDAGGNGDGHLDPGETAEISITNNNSGHSDALNAVGTLVVSNQYVQVVSNPVNIGTIAVGSNPVASFTVNVAGNAPYGIEVPFNYSVNAGNYSGIFDFSTVLAPAMEDFETNDFTQYEWMLSGTANWFTTGVNPYEGTYCSQSGDVNNNQSSTIEITLDAQFDDAISFAKKVSSESGYDFLNFYIDGQLKDQWSGEAGWSLSTYPVVAGEHNFKWTYTKDGYFSSGSDCAWLDNILLPPFEVNAGTGISSPSMSGNTVTVYPNPFSKISFIDYGIEEASDVTVRIIDASGREIKTIIRQEHQIPGTYHVGFDGTPYANGIYFCEVKVGAQAAVKKLVLNR